MKQTVAELIEFLRSLPQDALVVRDAGGDCSGFCDVVSDGSKDHWKTEPILLAPADGTSSYHGAYDEWEGIVRQARDAAPAAASDEEAVRLLADEEAKELARVEEEAAGVIELPATHNPEVWTLEAYRERLYSLSRRRAYIAFLRQGRPIAAVVLR